MKTIFTLLLVTLTTAAFAYDEGRITLTVASGRNLQVYIDNRLYQEYDNTYDLQGVQPGNHTIRIYRNSRNNGNVRNNRDRFNRQELVYSSTVYVRPSYHVDVMINRFGKAMVDERQMNTGYRDDDDYNNGGYGNGGYGQNNNGGYGASTYHQPMNNYDFERMLSSIKAQWFSSSKITTARDQISRNYFTAAQVKQLLDLFNTDDEKLELARLSYVYTIDRSNVYLWNDAFNFQSTKDQWQSFLRNYRDR